MADKRSKLIGARMTPQEAAAVTRRARALGLSREQYIRETLIRQDAGLESADSDERLLVVIAEGLGRLEKEARREIEEPQKKRQTLEKLDEVCGLFSQAAAGAISLEGKSAHET